MKTFKNKVAAITGAGSGIGRALSIELANRGCHLALSDVDKDGLDATLASLPKGVSVSRHIVDVASKEAVYGFADEVHERHGRVNLIFNNAGVALAGSVQQLPLEDYEWIMQINFWGVVYGTKAFLPLLEASGDGHVINVSSVFGLTAQPTMSGYNASKYAVRGFTEALAQDLDLADSCVNVTCVHPGGIKTNIARRARMDESAGTTLGLPTHIATRQFEKGFITSAEDAANVILRGVRRNKRRVLIGPDARLFDLFSRLTPAAYQHIFAGVVRMRRGGK